MARSMIARQNIKLNLVPGGVPPVLNVSQNDSAYDVHFTLYNGAQLFEIPDDVSIQFVEKKRDGNGYDVGATKSAQTGQCYIWMQKQMTAVPGDQICELILTNTTEDQIGTANFIMRVEPGPVDDDTSFSDSDIAYANQVLAQLGSVAAYKAQLDAQGNEIDQLNTNLAAEVAARQAADNTLQSNINSEASTRATADAALQSQINQLVAPEGAAPSAAEITNARVGADGTVYPTLGDAIRGQVTDVKTAITQTYDAMMGGENLLSVASETITKNGVTFTASTDGTVTASGTATVNAIYRIPFIPTKSGTYHLSGCPEGGGLSHYYLRVDESSNAIDSGYGADVDLVEWTASRVWIVIPQGMTVNGLVFAPKLLLVADNISEVAKGVNLFPYKPQVPPLFEGGMHGSTGQYHHDTNETWLKSRIRTGVVRVAKGAILTTSGNYKITVCRYADYEVTNYIETLVDATATKRWTCPDDGYYSFTFMLSNSSALTIDTVRSAWDFSRFYCIPDERLKVHWIGTGNESETSTYIDSGDCAFVVFPDGTGLLIDSANKRNYAIRRRLAEAGFYHIKNIIVSHFHNDHIGGIIQMVNNGYIDITGATVYLPDYDATLWAYNNGVMDDATKALYDEAMAIFSNAGCNLVYPDTDFKPYEIGGAVLSFYNTDMSYYEDNSSNYNDWSLCNYIFYGNVNINFTGDLGPIGQSHLGGSVYKSNIYKADHHGWLNQTVIPSKWINNVSPDVVVATDGAVHDTHLGTDTAPLVKWCDKNGVPYYRKYTNGEIVMAVSKDSWSFETKTTRYELPTT